MAGMLGITFIKRLDPKIVLPHNPENARLAKYIEKETENCLMRNVVNKYILRRTTKMNVTA